MHVFREVGTADAAAGWLAESLAAKRKIMGFGHRVYKNGDSRVPTMKAALERDITALLTELNVGGVHSLVVPSEYLEVVIERK